MRKTLAQRLGNRFLLITHRLNDIQAQHDDMGQIATDFGQDLFDIVQGSGRLLGDARADRAFRAIHAHLPGKQDAPPIRHFDGLAEAVLKGIEYGCGVNHFPMHDSSLLSVGKQG